MLESLTAFITEYARFLWIPALAISFGLLARLAPCNTGYPFLHKKSFINDIAYYLLMPFVNGTAHMVLMGVGIYIIFNGQPMEDVREYFVEGFGPAATLPIWAQAAIVFIAQDIYIYWMHRLFHTNALWRFHAIHHCSKHLDWHSTFRFHPVNTWAVFVMANVLCLLAGFAPAAIGCMATFNLIYSAMVHANVNWTFGPFKYVFASPVFHRWHHTTQKEGMNKNFAPTIPLLDVVFGTFYMPEGKLPEHYGIKGMDVPESFVGQMFFPFKRRPARPAKPVTPPQAG